MDNPAPQLPCTYVYDRPAPPPERGRFPWMKVRALPWLLLLALLSTSWLSAQEMAESALSPPELVFEGPDDMAVLLDELRGFDRWSLVPAMELLGLDEPGPPIRVIVAREGSIEARRAPSWVMAYAVGNAGWVVLLPQRIPAYPDGNLEQVLRHEIAHVLVARAAGRYGVPRWLNEGLAIVAAREWRFEDRGRLVLEAFRRRKASMADVELEFSRGSVSSARAYAVSVAFVRYLMDEHGSHMPARILDHVAEGKRFRTAFREATGYSLKDVEADFWADFDFWNRWVPFLTSSAALWMLVTALALLAFRRRRERDEALRQKWEEEELAELEALQIQDRWVN